MFPVPEKDLLWHIKNAAAFSSSTFYQISYPLYFPALRTAAFLLIKKKPEASNCLSDAWLIKEEWNLSC